jgi:hypothetical protein
MIAVILFIHVGFLEYLSFKQFKLIVKMTRIESVVTIPKGLFTLYLNVKKVTAKKFFSTIKIWPTPAKNHCYAILLLLLLSYNCFDK